MYQFLNCQKCWVSYLFFQNTKMIHVKWNKTELKKFQSVTYEKNWIDKVLKIKQFMFCSCKTLLSCYKCYIRKDIKQSIMKFKTLKLWIHKKCVPPLKTMKRESNSDSPRHGFELPTPVAQLLLQGEDYLASSHLLNTYWHLIVKVLEWSLFYFISFCGFGYGWVLFLVSKSYNTSVVITDANHQLLVKLLA